MTDLSCLRNFMNHVLIFLQLDWMLKHKIIFNVAPAQLQAPVFMFLELIVERLH